MILHSDVEQVMAMCRVQEWQLSLSYFLSYFPLMVSDAISCPLHNLNALWYIIIILYSYDKSVLMICCAQEWQLSPLHFLSYLPLRLKLQCPLFWIPLGIFSWDYAVRFCRRGHDRCVLCKKYGGSAPPPPPPQKKKNKKKTYFFPWIWILCQNSLARERKIRFVGIIL